MLLLALIVHRSPIVATPLTATAAFRGVAEMLAATAHQTRTAAAAFRVWTGDVNALIPVRFALTPAIAAIPTAALAGPRDAVKNPALIVLQQTIVAMACLASAGNVAAPRLAHLAPMSAIAAIPTAALADPRNAAENPAPTVQKKAIAATAGPVRMVNVFAYPKDNIAIIRQIAAAA